MRVQVRAEVDEAGEKFEIPWKKPAEETSFVDLRTNPGAVENIEAARENRALASFLVAVNSGDSLFQTAGVKVWLENDPADDQAFLFSGRFVFAFAEPAMNFNQDSFTRLLSRLQGLLSDTEASEAIRVGLAIHLCRYAEVSRWGFCASLLVQAWGSAEEQARLRWALGLAHVQKALLFSSRVLRQERASKA
jgi:hypothetical protein